MSDFKEAEEQEGSKGRSWNGDRSKTVRNLELKIVNEKNSELGSKKMRGAHREEEEVKPKLV